MNLTASQNEQLTTAARRFLVSLNDERQSFFVYRTREVGGIFGFSFDYPRRAELVGVTSANRSTPLGNLKSRTLSALEE